MKTIFSNVQQKTEYRKQSEKRMKKDRIKKYCGIKSCRPTLLQSVSDFFRAIFSLCTMSNFGEYLEYKS